jgi:DNA-binding response OmpR family regulator
MGADDYVAKPFELMEISARLRAISRRREVRANLETLVKELGDDFVMEDKQWCMFGLKESTG